MRSLSGSKYNENIGKWQTHTWLNISAIFKEQSGDTEALKEESSNLQKRLSKIANSKNEVKIKLDKEEMDILKQNLRSIFQK